MNSLIILPEECVDSKRAVLTGARAKYAVKVHGVSVGSPCRVAVLGVARGEGRIVGVSPELVEVEILSSIESLERLSVDLIVGVPRPQTVKKVIQSAVMLGVRSLHFVQSELGEKSYLQSKALHEREIRDEGIKALEQVWDGYLPDIRVHRSFNYFVDNHLPQLMAVVGGSCFIAHPGGAALTVSCREIVGINAVISVGPERGWSDREVRVFCEQGFRQTGLGQRVVRVEVALVLLLGQLKLLMGQRNSAE